MAKNFESFLRRLGCIKKGEVIPLDWDDWQEWHWTSYCQRVKKHEQEKSNATE